MGECKPDISVPENDIIFANDHVSLRSSGDGHVAVTVGSGYGAVALVFRNGKVLVVRTPRYATDTLEWELPRAGSLKSESAVDTAARCVEGWTGVRVHEGTAIPLGTVTPDPELLTNEVSLLFMHAASGSILTNHENAKWVDVEALVSACVEDEIKDSFTVITVLRARLNGLI